MRIHTYLFLFAIVRPAKAFSSCGAGSMICSPPGATSATTPQIGSADFQNLFVDIVKSSLPASKRSLPHLARGSASLCCDIRISCLTLSSLAIPFCYDQFTTNYVLPDGSAGTVVNGAYKSAGGDVANLETGDYTLANGQTGNIYSANPAAKPNLATLSLPTQYTASGVGSAIPIASLGSAIVLTYTTTLPGSTLPPSTVPPSTLPGTISTETILLPITTTISAVSRVSPSLSFGVETSYSVVNISPSIIHASTIPGSTIALVVTTITTTTYSALSASSSAASSNAAATTTKNGGSKAGPNAGLWFMGGVLLWLV